MTDAKRVFDYFDDITKIPRGSGNMKGIKSFCMDFAAKNDLRSECDDMGNVIIYKDGTFSLKNAEPVILQGHLDMVCQKIPGSDFDFEKDSIKTFRDGDFIKADGTTLGADNAVAVAMIMAILESDEIEHPPIEAVFTADEEIGMLGAAALDFEKLTAKRMINLDSEGMGVLTVSCAGGCDFKTEITFEKEIKSGKRVDINISGLFGGHSGVDINKCRQNANMIMGRILNHLKSVSDFNVMAIAGGDKGNVIPSDCSVKLLVSDDELFCREAEKIFETIKKEICDNEPYFSVSVSADGEGEFQVIDKKAEESLIFLLTCAPNGIIEMSAKVENLVETSLNLGVLKTEENKITAIYTLRSNKGSALSALCEKMTKLTSSMGLVCESSGFYAPWEFKENSKLQSVCEEIYKKRFGEPVKIEAIHAGLECGIFASKIKDFDCVSMGPDMYDIHSVNERLSISSTEKLFDYLVEIMKNLK